jgi:DNA-binding MarR family transcriptional regulator
MENCNIIVPPTKRAELGSLLLHLADDVLDAANLALAPQKISESKLALLLLFVSQNDKNHFLLPSEIAEKLGIRRASVTKQLIWLEKRRLISRSVSAKDQRMVNVNITSDGYELLARVMPLYWRACTELSNGLSEEEVMLLFTLLQKIHK